MVSRRPAANPGEVLLIAAFQCLSCCLCCIPSILVALWETHRTPRRFERDKWHNCPTNQIKEHIGGPPQPPPPGLEPKFRHERAAPKQGQPETKSPLPQLQSPLFKIPVEIRIKIYEYAISSSNVQVTAVPAGYKHRYGFVDQETNLFITQQTPQSWLPASQRNFLALPRTCSKIYRETIEMIYTNNNLEFLSLNDYWTFRGCIPPRIATKVTSMTIDLMYLNGIPWSKSRWYRLGKPVVEKSRARMWTTFCGSVRSMDSLKNLEIYIRTHPSWNHRKEEYCHVFTQNLWMDILEPMVRIRHVPEINVYLDGNTCSGPRPILPDEVPFKLTFL